VEGRLVLTLSRRKGEAILIGHDVMLTVIGLNPDGSVRLGIQAPPSVAVDRAEVRARKLAAAAAGGDTCAR
jgi:carbon storage regulator